MTDGDGWEPLWCQDPWQIITFCASGDHWHQMICCLPLAPVGVNVDQDEREIPRAQDSRIPPLKQHCASRFPAPRRKPNQTSWAEQPPTPLNTAYCAVRAGEHIVQGTEDRRVLGIGFYSNWIKSWAPKTQEKQDTSEKEDCEKVVIERMLSKLQF